MALSSDLISQFAKITKDNTDTKKESTVYGTTVVHSGTTYVKLDGSDRLTPVSTTTDTKDGERVTVMIKNHTATITGNISSPAARTEDTKKTASNVTELEIATAYRITTEDLNAVTAYIDNLKTIVGKFESVSTEDLTAVNAEIESIEAKFIDVDTLTAEDVRIVNATIESIQGKIATFTDVSTEDLEAANAVIGQLKAYNGKFTYLFADELDAINANIKNLDVNKLSAEDAEIKYVNIDFGNIDKAWMEEFYSRSGIIEYIEGADGTFSGTLVGVTIKGDLIEGNTIKADKLVIKSDTDGLYYKLNFEGGHFTDAEEVPTDSIHGSVITAKSIAAEKINVKDLVAFGATIGGFNITDGAIYSGVKESIDNTTEGLYAGKDGQVFIGNTSNYLKFYRELKCILTDEILDALDGALVVDECVYEENQEDFDVYLYTDSDGEKTYYAIVDDEYYRVEVEELYKLKIMADSIFFGTDDKRSLDDIKALTEHVKIGTWEDPDTGDVNPSIELAEGDSDFKQVITNKASRIMDGSNVVTEMDNEGINTENLTSRGEYRQKPANASGYWAWVTHGKGNLGLMWKEEVTE